MEEKEKKPWRPPEMAQLPDPIAFAMQGFERFGLPKERLIPPLQTFDRVMQHSAFTENRWWENARQVTATTSAEQWRRVSIERARCLGEPWPDFDDIPVASITEDFSQKCQNATIGLLRDQVIASCAIPGETSFRDIFNQLGIKEDNMDRSLADKKFKRVTIECEDGTTYAGKINHVCGSPYRCDKLCVEAMVEDKPIGAYGIEKVLFQNPATIVFWSDGTKTVVNCMDNVEIKKKVVDGKEVTIRKPKKADTYSEEAGLAMAIVKKWAGNNGNYNNIFREFMYNPVEYFDEMNILKDDKLRRKKTAKEFINALVDFFAAQFLNLISGIFLYEKTSADYENELMDLYFAMMPEYQYETEVREKAYRFSKYIQEATERAVANANGNDDYKMSRMTGGMMKEEDVPKSVKRMFSEVRATEIALNETNWIYNWINHQNLVDKKQTTHTWVSMRDERVRVSHWEADSQTVPINEPFIINGYKMMFPLDDSMGAPIDEIINCRCVEL